MANLTLYNGTTIDCCAVVVGATSGQNPATTQSGPMRALQLLLMCFTKATISEANPNGLNMAWGITRPGGYSHCIYIQSFEDTNEPLGKVSCYVAGNDIYLEHKSSSDTWAAVWAVAYFCELLFDAKMLWPGYYGLAVKAQQTIVLTEGIQNWIWEHPLEHYHAGNVIADYGKGFCFWHGAEQTTANAPTSRVPYDANSYEKNWTSLTLNPKVNAVGSPVTKREIPSHPNLSPYSIAKRFPQLSGFGTNGLRPNTPSNKQKIDIVTSFAHNPLYKRFEAPRTVYESSTQKLKDPYFAVTGHQNEGRFVPVPSPEQVYVYDWIHRDRCGQLLDEYQWGVGANIGVQASAFWTGDFNAILKANGVDYSADGFTHVVGNTEALHKPIRIQKGDTMELSFVIAGATSGSISVHIKDMSYVDPGAQAITAALSGNTGLNNGTHTFTFNYTGNTIVSFVAFTPTEDFDGTVRTISLRKTSFAYDPVVNLFPIDGGSYSTNMHPMPSIYTSIEDRESFRKAVYYAAAPNPAFQSTHFNNTIGRMNLGETPNILTYTFTRQYIRFYKRIEAYVAYLAENFTDSNSAIQNQVRARLAACRFAILIYHRYTFFPTGLRVDLSRFDAYITGGDTYSQPIVRNMNDWIETGVKIFWRNNIFFNFPIAPFNKQNTDCEIWEAMREFPINSRRVYLDGYINFNIHSAQPLYFYTVNRMFRRPDLSYEEIQDEFYSCFGAAKSVIRRYFEKCIDASQGAPFTPVTGSEKRRDIRVSIRHFNYTIFEHLVYLLPPLSEYLEADLLTSEEADRYNFIRKGLELSIMAYRLHSPITTIDSPWHKISVFAFSTWLNDTLDTEFPKDPPITPSGSRDKTNGFGKLLKIEQAAGVIAVPSEADGPAGYYAVALITCNNIGNVGDSAQVFGIDTSTGYSPNLAGPGVEVSFQAGPVSVTVDMVEPEDYLNELAVGSSGIGAKWPSGTNSNSVPYTTMLAYIDGVLVGVYIMGSAECRPVKDSFNVVKTGDLDITVEEMFFPVTLSVPGGGTTVNLTGPNNTFDLTNPDGSADFPANTKVVLTNLPGTVNYPTSAPLISVVADGATLHCTMPGSGIPLGNDYSIKVLVPNEGSGVRDTLGVSTINITVE